MVATLMAATAAPAVMVAKAAQSLRRPPQVVSVVTVVQGAMVERVVKLVPVARLTPPPTMATPM
jgi:hypothetical protein